MTNFEVWYQRFIVLFIWFIIRLNLISRLLSSKARPSSNEVYVYLDLASVYDSVELHVTVCRNLFFPKRQTSFITNNTEVGELIFELIFCNCAILTDILVKKRNHTVNIIYRYLLSLIILWLSLVFLIFLSFHSLILCDLSYLFASIQKIPRISIYHTSRNYKRFLSRRYYSHPCWQLNVCLILYYQICQPFARQIFSFWKSKSAIHNPGLSSPH